MYMMLAQFCVVLDDMPKTPEECAFAVKECVPAELLPYALHHADDMLDTYRQLRKKNAIRMDFPVEKVRPATESNTQNEQVI
jgi:hypothetical protein